MANTLQKSCIRLEHEPHTVDISNSRARVRATSRWRKDNDDKVKYRPKRVDSHRSSRRETSHRRKVSHTLPTSNLAELPPLFLDMMRQPAKSIQLGMLIDASAIISVDVLSYREHFSVESFDSSALFAVVSLVADQYHGERAPLEAGTLTGQKMFDSVHPISESHLENSRQNQGYRNILGYFSFPGLLIRQAGTYRIRITLFRMSNVTGATSLLAVDSEPIKVEHRGYAPPCQR